MKQEWTGKSVLVTGGAGFIGSRVVSKLVKLGARVLAVDDLSKGEASNLADVINEIEFIQGDLLDPAMASRCMKGIDVCFHFAAKIGGIGFFNKYPAGSVRDNALLNLNLWEAARNTGAKMVCVSSSMVFERTRIFPTPETAVESSPPPLTGYGFSKLIGEYIATTYYQEFSIPYIIVRPFNAYGPGENPGDWVGYAHVIPDLVDKVLKGQYPLEILGSGRQTRSYTYVEDVADATVFVTTRAENTDFNIGTGVGTSVADLARLIWKLCNRKESLRFKHLPPLKYDVVRRIPDITKITSLGWRPKVTLEQGLRNTIKWIKKKGAVGG